jgi:nucleotide-binding universal stress UspA family protein
MAQQLPRNMASMFSLGNILAPVDFSPSSEAAVRSAAALASRFGARLALLHAAAAGDAESARQRMGGFVEDVAAERVVATGDPAEAIVEHAHRNGCDLIAMPTRGWGPFRRFILGSVAAKVLHDAQCAVWTGVHQADGGFTAPLPRRVACALDLAPDDGAPLCWAARIAQACGAPVLAIHAIPSLEYRPQFQYLEADMRRALVGDARLKIAQMLAGMPGVQGEMHVEGGTVARVVRAAAEDYRADLLVIGRSSGGTRLGRLRTHSYAIIREAPCPVISL